LWFDVLTHGVKILPESTTHKISQKKPLFDTIPQKGGSMERTFISHESYGNVIIFEFFMPLRNEGELKRALDELFYRDPLVIRLKKVPIARLQEIIPPIAKETQNAYYERIMMWISARFTGYSITHDSGRFKLLQLTSFKGAADIQQKGGQYLDDETTAVVRFIFPCGSAQDKPIFFDYSQSSSVNSPSEISDVKPSKTDLQFTDINHEATVIRFFFNMLFVENILQVVKGEHEIWMLESGMRTRLHIWRTKSGGFQEICSESK
jgi:hypothetical protein